MISLVSILSSLLYSAGKEVAVLENEQLKGVGEIKDISTSGNKMVVACGDSGIIGFNIEMKHDRPAQGPPPAFDFVWRPC